MDKRILTSVLVIAVVALMVGGATFVYFNDSETSSGNTFTAGTLDLKVDGEDDPNIVSVTLNNMKPGDNTGYYKWVLKNAGTQPGKPSVTFSIIVNDDNGLIEPEQKAGDTTGGAGEGELGQYLKPTIGQGPKNWTVPSTLYSVWQTGPPHSWGTPGLNGLGGKTYGQGVGFTFPVLGPGEEVAFFLKLQLDANLRIWTGTTWVEVDDNIIQSDSVKFDMTFRLDQS